jgi:hypothetical protein
LSRHRWDQPGHAHLDALLADHECR